MKGVAAWRPDDMEEYVKKRAALIEALNQRRGLKARAARELGIAPYRISGVLGESIINNSILTKLHQWAVDVGLMPEGVTPGSIIS